MKVYTFTTQGNCCTFKTLAINELVLKGEPLVVKEESGTVMPSESVVECAPIDTDVDTETTSAVECWFFGCDAQFDTHEEFVAHFSAAHQLSFNF